MDCASASAAAAPHGERRVAYRQAGRRSRDRRDHHRRKPDEAARPPVGRAACPRAKRRQARSAGRTPGVDRPSCNQRLCFLAGLPGAARGKAPGQFCRRQGQSVSCSTVPCLGRVAGAGGPPDPPGAGLPGRLVVRPDAHDDRERRS
ncbi:hypothetical protein G6F22_018460 [Rhizopus arrhizus]|nr:hypothetical protein G6F22_018460 [Rhizopus arrhizus]